MAKENEFISVNYTMSGKELVERLNKSNVEFGKELLRELLEYEDINHADIISVFKSHNITLE